MAAGHLKEKATSPFSPCRPAIEKMENQRFPTFQHPSGFPLFPLRLSPFSERERVCLLSVSLAVQLPPQYRHEPERKPKAYIRNQIWQRHKERVLKRRQQRYEHIRCDTYIIQRHLLSGRARVFLDQADDHAQSNQQRNHDDHLRQHRRNVARNSLYQRVEQLGIKRPAVGSTRPCRKRRNRHQHHDCPCRRQHGDPASPCCQSPCCQTLFHTTEPLCIIFDFRLDHRDDQAVNPSEEQIQKHNRRKQRDYSKDEEYHAGTNFQNSGCDLLRCNGLVRLNRQIVRIAGIKNSVALRIIFLLWLRPCLWPQVHRRLRTRLRSRSHAPGLLACRYRKHTSKEHAPNHRSDNEPFNNPFHLNTSRIERPAP